MGLLMRIGFFIIIFLFYLLGDFVTKKTGSPVKFETLLPAFSLVFWDYYKDMVSGRLLRLKVVSKKALHTDGKIHSVQAEIKLINRGNEEITFVIEGVEIVGYKTEPSLSVNNKNEIPECYHCTVKKNALEPIALKCTFTETPVRKIRILNHDFYFFVLKLKYTVNDSPRIKRLPVFKDLHCSFISI